MRKNKDIYLLVGDLGYGGADKIRDEFPDRFLNVGAAEQTMLDIAVGLAYEGKLPFCYTITPFFFRGFETIRTYIAHENLPVFLVGSGRDRDYAHDGFSHDASDMKRIFNELESIVQYYPNSLEEVEASFKLILDYKFPSFISLAREVKHGQS
jgi:transketolase